MCPHKDKSCGLLTLRMARILFSGHSGGSLADVLSEEEYGPGYSKDDPDIGKCRRLFWKLVTKYVQRSENGLG
jgi:hypothetical protein